MADKKPEDLKIDHVDDKLIPKHHKSMKLAILNAPVLTACGNYTCYPIPTESARILVNSMEIESHVGHETTAKLISKILECPISFCRDELKHQVGQNALIFKLKHRAPEGKILDERQLSEIGYEFWILYRSR
jgi:Domain of unknown function (DUF1874)